MAIPNEVEEDTLTFGIEIECEISQRAARKIEIGPYHHGISCSANWKAEQDNSLRTTKPNFVSVEFVSKTGTAKKILRYIDELRELIGDDEGELVNIAINNSNGAHLHFSNNGSHLYKKMPFDTLKLIRNKASYIVRNRIKSVYPSWKKQYFRSYAKRFSEQKYKHDLSQERSTEFNFTTDKGVEWRSFNLLGVKTWAELKAVVNAGLVAVDFAVGRELRSPKPFLQTLKVEVETDNIMASEREVVIQINPEGILNDEMEVVI